MLPPELEERFRRVYAAVGETFSRNPDDYVRVTEQKVGTQTTATITFDGGRSKEQLKNDAMFAVASVANLKDHLRSFAKKAGKNPDDVDTTIKGSLDLAVLVDLNNAEKHGEGSRGPGRWSGLRPKLAEVRAALRFTGSPTPPSFTITLIPGARAYSNPQVEGGAAAVISTDVVDENGKKVAGGDLTGMVEAGLKAFEQMLAAWGVSLPPRA